MKTKIIAIVFLAGRLSGAPQIEVMPYPQAVAQVCNWCAQGAQHTQGEAGWRTHSEAPYLVGHELLLLEIYSGQQIEPGQLLVYARWDKPAVLHEVVTVSKTEMKMKGRNCMYSDGWYPFNRTRFIVRRVIRVSSGK